MISCVTVTQVTKHDIYHSYIIQKMSKLKAVNSNYFYFYFIFYLFSFILFLELGLGLE